MPSGKVIFLNGTTSSGKTSLAQALQEVLDAPYFHADADRLKEMTGRIPPAERGAAFKRSEFMPALYAGIPLCFAAIASLGSNLIVDDVMRPLQLRSYVDAFANCEVLFVGVHCSEDELERRERERGNRRIGRAKEQLQDGLVHALGIYDLEVDTTNRTALECAEEVKRRLDLGIVPDAFRRLAALPIEDLWNMTDTFDQSIYQALHPALPWKSP